MNRVECEFEPDVLAAVLQSLWPDRVDADLRAHVAGCEICSDVAAVAGALEETSSEMRSRTALPDAGLVWWRAQLRARREAVQAAGRPITVAQLVALACAVGLLGACWGATSTWFQATLGWVSSSLAGFDLTSLIVEHGAFVIGMVAIVFLIPTAVYVALGRD